jgi:hypothetical protein
MRWRSLWKAWRQKRIGIPSTRPPQVSFFFFCMFRVLFVALSEMSFVVVVVVVVGVVLVFYFMGPSVTEF